MADDFSSKLIAMHQRITQDLHTRLNMELERAHKLEQLVKDAIPIIESYGTPREWYAWLDRAKALLEQEVK